MSFFRCQSCGMLAKKDSKQRPQPVEIVGPQQCVEFDLAHALPRRFGCHGPQEALVQALANLTVRIAEPVERLAA